MKTTIGVYDTKEAAVSTAKELTDQGFSPKKISVIGRVAEGDADFMADEELMEKAGKRVGLTTLIGSTVGILSGVGIFAIPGLGFIFGAGALMGAIAGFDIGLIGGGLISALSLANVKGDIAKKYEEHLQAGKFLLIAQGNEEDLKKAHELMQNHRNHHTLESQTKRIYHDLV